MSFKEEQPDEWNKRIEAFGYICPMCGNDKEFNQFWRVVKDISCDEETGIITYSDTEYDDDLHPQITEVECKDCGNEAEICKKGVVINVFNHHKCVKFAESE